MKPVRTIVRSLYGSQLYGTARPDSDTDWKSVHLPSGKGILLGRHEDQFDNNDPSKPNGAGDADEESHSLRKFLGMAAAGEMLAIELLFAEGSAVEVHDPLWHEVRALTPRIVTRDCLGFVGYCQRQAAAYSIKGSRLLAARDTADFLSGLRDRHGPDARLRDHDAEIRAFCEGRLHVAVEFLNGGAKEQDFLVLCDRKYPFSSTVDHTLMHVGAVLKSYGRRAETAAENGNVDLKATMHALRVASQAVELLNTGHITFPRQDAEHLMAIRAGAFGKEQLAEMLQSALIAIDRAAVSSALPYEADHAAIDYLVLRAHRSQIAAG